MGYDVSNITYNCSIQEGIETGFYLLDEHLKDLKMGEITILLGRNGDGKTTMVSQIINHCCHKKVKTYLYSGELNPFKVQDWIYKSLLGRNEKFYNIVDGKYEKEYLIKSEIVRAIKRWHKELFFLFDNGNNLKLRNKDSFFDIIKKDIEEFKPKLFIIDNLATSISENHNSLYTDQSNVVQTCKLMSIYYNIHIVLVVHPNKGKEEINTCIQQPTLTKNDISGTNNIANKADNIITIERNWYNGEDRIKYDGWISSIKDRTRGYRKVIGITFNKDTLRMYDDKKNSNDYKVYSFLDYLDKQYDKEDYLEQKTLKERVQETLFE